MPALSVIINNNNDNDILFTYLIFRLDFATNLVDTCEQTAFAQISYSRETKSRIFTDIKYVFPGTARLQFAEGRRMFGYLNTSKIMYHYSEIIFIS